MYLFMNIIVLLFEVIYYSLFMKFARKEGKVKHYLLAFSVATIFNILFSFLKLSDIVVYVLFMLIALNIIKLFDKKISLYDLFFIFLIMVVKIIIEGISCLLIYNFVSNFVFTIIIDVLKIGFVLIYNKKICSCYKILKIKWENNNFFIRYIFNILLFVFIIMSFVFIVIR